MTTARDAALILPNPGNPVALFLVLCGDFRGAAATSSPVVGRGPSASRGAAEPAETCRRDHVENGVTNTELSSASSRAPAQDDPADLSRNSVMNPRIGKEQTSRDRRDARRICQFWL